MNSIGMKTIGLIGGMSWESTRIYYELINRDVQRRLGGIHSAKMLIASLDMQLIAELQREAKWQEAGELLASQAMALQRGGADLIALATNTMHKCTPQILPAISVPFLHVIDALNASMRTRGLGKPLLLATRFTMEDSFYRDRLARHGIDAKIPDVEDRHILHGIIYDELCKGIVEQGSMDFVVKEIAKAKQEGADSVILGCTEICMLVNEANSVLPVFDTTQIHAAALVDFAMS